MTEYESLMTALDGCFDKQLSELPDSLRERVDGEFFLKRWDYLSEEQRLSAAQQVDFQEDPAYAKEGEFLWDFYTKLRELKKEIENWEDIATPTAIDLAKQEQRLLELKAELARMRQKEEELISGKAGSEESSDERQKRLKDWFSEEQRLRGEIGAQARTANREGVTRQVVAEILKREG